MQSLKYTSTPLKLTLPSWFIHYTCNTDRHTNTHTHTHTQRSKESKEFFSKIKIEITPPKEPIIMDQDVLANTKKTYAVDKALLVMLTVLK